MLDLRVNSQMAEDLIPNANDPNFKNLLSKLIAAKWLTDFTDTPATETSKRNFVFQWTTKGQLCGMTLKMEIRTTPLWKEAKSFLDSLNEQEEAFFHDVFLSALHP